MLEVFLSDLKSSFNPQSFAGIVLELNQRRIQGGASYQESLHRIDLLCTDLNQGDPIHQMQANALQTIVEYIDDRNQDERLIQGTENLLEYFQLQPKQNSIVHHSDVRNALVKCVKSKLTSSIRQHKTTTLSRLCRLLNYLLPDDADGSLHLVEILKHHLHYAKETHQTQTSQPCVLSKSEDLDQEYTRYQESIKKDYLVRILQWKESTKASFWSKLFGQGEPPTHVIYSDLALQKLLEALQQATLDPSSTSSEITLSLKELHRILKALFQFKNLADLHERTPLQFSRFFSKKELKLRPQVQEMLKVNVSICRELLLDFTEVFFHLSVQRSSALKSQKQIHLSPSYLRSLYQIWLEEHRTPTAEQNLIQSTQTQHTQEVQQTFNRDLQMITQVISLLNGIQRTSFESLVLNQPENHSLLIFTPLTQYHHLFDQFNTLFGHSNPQEIFKFLQHMLNYHYCELEHFDEHQQTLFKAWFTEFDLILPELLIQYPKQNLKQWELLRQELLFFCHIFPSNEEWMIEEDRLTLSNPSTQEAYLKLYDHQRIIHWSEWMTHFKDQNYSLCVQSLADFDCRTDRPLLLLYMRALINDVRSKTNDSKASDHVASLKKMNQGVLDLLEAEGKNQIQIPQKWLECWLGEFHKVCQKDPLYFQLWIDELGSGNLENASPLRRKGLMIKALKPSLFKSLKHMQNQPCSSAFYQVLKASRVWSTHKELSEIQATLCDLLVKLTLNQSQNETIYKSVVYLLQFMNLMIWDKEQKLNLEMKLTHILSLTHNTFSASAKNRLNAIQSLIELIQNLFPNQFKLHQLLFNFAPHWNSTFWRNKANSFNLLAFRLITHKHTALEDLEAYTLEYLSKGDYIDEKTEQFLFDPPLEFNLTKSFFKNAPTFFDCLYQRILTIQVELKHLKKIRKEKEKQGKSLSSEDQKSFNELKLRHTKILSFFFEFSKSFITHYIQSDHPQLKEALREVIKPTRQSQSGKQGIYGYQNFFFTSFEDNLVSNVDELDPARGRFLKSCIALCGFLNWPRCANLIKASLEMKFDYQFHFILISITSHLFPFVSKSDQGWMNVLLEDLNQNWDQYLKYGNRTKEELRGNFLKSVANLFYALSLSENESILGHQIYQDSPAAHIASIRNHRKHFKMLDPEGLNSIFIMMRVYNGVVETSRLRPNVDLHLLDYQPLSERHQSSSSPLQDQLKRSLGVQQFEYTVPTTVKEEPSKVYGLDVLDGLSQLNQDDTESEFSQTAANSDLILHPKETLRNALKALSRGDKVDIPSQSSPNRDPSQDQETDTDQVQKSDPVARLLKIMAYKPNVQSIDLHTDQPTKKQDLQADLDVQQKSNQHESIPDPHPQVDPQVDPQVNPPQLISLNVSSIYEANMPLSVELTLQSHQRLTHWSGLADTLHQNIQPQHSFKEYVSFDSFKHWIYEYGVPYQRHDLIHLLSSVGLRLPEVWEVQVLMAMGKLSSHQPLWTRNHRDLLWSPVESGGWTVLRANQAIQLVAFWIQEGEEHLQSQDKEQIAEASEWLKVLANQMLNETSFGID